MIFRYSHLSEELPTWKAMLTIFRCCPPLEEVPSWQAMTMIFRCSPPSGRTLIWEAISLGGNVYVGGYAHELPSLASIGAKTLPSRGNPPKNTMSLIRE